MNLTFLGRHIPKLGPHKYDFMKLYNVKKLTQIFQIGTVIGMAWNRQNKIDLQSFCVKKVCSSSQGARADFWM